MREGTRESFNRDGNGYGDGSGLAEKEKGGKIESRGKWRKGR